MPLGHRQLRSQQALTCDLPLAELMLEVQPQDLVDLSHGLSLSGHFDRPSWDRAMITRG